MTRWPLPPFIKFSVACHVAALVAVLVAPSQWPWALGAVIANHAAITVLGLWPRSQWLGKNLLRLPDAAAVRGEIALTIDDGPDPAVTPAVLDLLDAARARATFFCIAERAERHPQLVREIVRRGHSVQNHTARHSHRFAFSGPNGFAREVAAAQGILERLTGERPVFFRAPAGLRNPFLGPALHRHGLTLASWTHRGFDTRETDADRVFHRLTRHLRAGDILLMHDGHAARTPAGQPVILDVLPRLLAHCRTHHLHPVTMPQAFASQVAPTGRPATASA